MGCDIHSYAEKKVDGKFVCVTLPREPFGDRSYGTFAFLAGVRNYSGVPALQEPRGFPEDASPEVKEMYNGWGSNGHTASFLDLEQLTSFNYDAIMEDRRYTKQISLNSFNGGATCEPGQGKMVTWRKFLGRCFFNDIDMLKEAGVDRIVFWFDS